MDREKNNKKSVILMTTYNGERYIGKQIESIRRQSLKDWVLYIRDDGSTDRTVDFLKNICTKDSRIQLFLNETGQHGSYLNFFTLIDFVKQQDAADYYFFADQDDIWIQDKLEMMIQAAEQSGYNDKPLLVYADMQIIDENDDVIYESLHKVMGIGDIDKYSLYFTHGFLWGCDVMANSVLFQNTPCLSRDHSLINIVSHDNYFGKFALSTGKILFVNRTGIKHRRHGDNATGGYEMKLSPIAVIKKAVFSFDKLAMTHARVYNQTLCFVEQARTAGVDNPDISKVEHIIRTGGIYGAFTFVRWKVKRKQFSRTIGIYLVMLCKSYKKYLIKAGKLR